MNTLNYSIMNINVATSTARPVLITSRAVFRNNLRTRTLQNGYHNFQKNFSKQITQTSQILQKTFERNFCKMCEFLPFSLKSIQILILLSRSKRKGILTQKEPYA